VTVVEEVTRLAARLGELAQWRKAKDLTLGIGRRADELAGVQRELAVLVAALYKLEENVQPENLAEFNVLRATSSRSVIELGRAYERPENVLATELHGPAIESLRNLVTKTRTLVQAGWRDLVSRQPGGKRAELLAALTSLGRFRVEASALAQIQVKCDELARVLVPKPDEVDKWLALMRQWQEGWRPIEDSLAPEVAHFLGEATSNGAELNLLTKAVRDWLQSQGLESAFRVRAT